MSLGGDLINILIISKRDLNLNKMSLDALNANQELAVDAPLDFEAFKREQRAQLESRMKIQMRIEAMRREFDFISKLDTGDVGYVLQKKREQAAIAIQRNFRMQKAKRELRDRRAGLYKKEDDEDLLLTAYDLAKVKEHSEELRL